MTGHNLFRSSTGQDRAHRFGTHLLCYKLARNIFLRMDRFIEIARLDLARNGCKFSDILETSPFIWYNFLEILSLDLARNRCKFYSLVFKSSNDNQF